MLDLNSVNPTTLPSMPITMKKGLPVCPSVYFVLEGKEVVYIGRSVNLNNRWKNHHRFSQLSQDAVIAWLEISDESLLEAVEKALICFFDPRLNSTKTLIENERFPLDSFTKRREYLGLSQRDIAIALNVTDQTISNWETGQRTPKLSPQQTLRLCRVLNCTLEELAGEKHD